MQEVIQQLIDKAGLTREQAEKSVEVIREFILTKIPPMMQPMVDNFLGMNPEENQ
jgi:nucleoid DNA-binding protein